MMRSLRRSMVVSVFCAVTAGMASSALATADGPDFWEAAGTAPVALHAAPDAASTVVGTLPVGTRGLRNMGCKGRPALSEWLSMSDSERKDIRAKVWCQTKFAGKTGWVNSMNLSEPKGVAPAFDCGRAEGAVEELLCRDDDLAKLDREMAGVYWSGIATAAMSGANAKEAKNTLKAMQRGWIKGRNDCWKEQDIPACVRASYEWRLTELEARWGLVDATQYFEYRCDGGASVSVELYTTTHLEAVAVTHNGMRNSYMRAVAASGVKYNGRSGREFWMKGKDAVFTYEHGVSPLNCSQN